MCSHNSIHLVNTDVTMQNNNFYYYIPALLQSVSVCLLVLSCVFVVWSVAEHGPTEILVQRLRPLLMKYNITAYFCGHDHNAQHIHESGSSVEYFVTGAAHKTDPSEAHKVSNVIDK